MTRSLNSPSYKAYWIIRTIKINKFIFGGLQVRVRMRKFLLDTLAGQRLRASDAGWRQFDIWDRVFGGFLSLEVDRDWFCACDGSGSWNWRHSCEQDAKIAQWGVWYRQKKEFGENLNHTLVTSKSKQNKRVRWVWRKAGGRESASEGGGEGDNFGKTKAEHLASWTPSSVRSENRPSMSSRWVFYISYTHISNSDLKIYFRARSSELLLPTRILYHRMNTIRWTMSMSMWMSMWMSATSHHLCLGRYLVYLVVSRLSTVMLYSH